MFRFFLKNKRINCNIKIGGRPAQGTKMLYYFNNLPHWIYYDRFIASKKKKTGLHSGQQRTTPEVNYQTR